MAVTFRKISLFRAARVVLAATSCAVLSISSSGASLSHSVSGDSATIAYYKKVVNKTNHVGHTRGVVSNYYFFGYSSPNNWVLGWGESKPLYAYERAVDDTQVTESVNGLIKWRTDTFATPCKTGTSCTSKITALRILSTSKGDYWAYVNGPHNTVKCWKKASSAGGTLWMNSDFRVSYAYWKVDTGRSTHYKPMVKIKNVVNVTSQYPTSTYRQGVTEIDQIDASKLLFTKSSYVVTKGTHGEPAYSYTVTYSYPSKGSTMPVTNHC